MWTKQGLRACFTLPKAPLKMWESKAGISAGTAVCASALLFFTLLSFLCCLMVCRSSIALLKPHHKVMSLHPSSQTLGRLHCSSSISPQTLGACVLVSCCHVTAFSLLAAGAGARSASSKAWQQPRGLCFSGSRRSAWQGTRSPAQGTAAKRLLLSCLGEGLAEPKQNRCKGT